MISLFLREREESVSVIALMLTCVLCVFFVYSVLWGNFPFCKSIDCSFEREIECYFVDSKDWSKS